MLASHSSTRPVTALLVAMVTLSAAPIVWRHDRTEERAVELARSYTMTAQVSADGCGTLIAPTWVLTAAHVARGVSPFAPHVRVEGETYGIARIVLHPDGRSREPGRPPKVDLALIELDRPVEGVSPAALYRGDDELGREVLVVGYGDFGAGGSELAHQNDRRRAATNVIDDAGPERLVFRFDAPPEGTDLEGMGGPGDSGGPLLLVEDDTVSLVGVSSASMGGRPGAYGTRDIYTRVSSFAGWVDDTLADPPPTMIALGTPVDLASEGFPDSAEGQLVAAFFAALEAGDDESLVAFSRDFRLSGARRDRPDKAWAEMIGELRADLGTLTPRQIASGPRGDLQVLVGGKSGGQLVLGFLIQQRDGPKLDGLAIQ